MSENSLPVPHDVQNRREMVALEYLSCLLLVIAFDAELFIYDEESLEQEIERARFSYAEPTESLRRLVRRLAKRLEVKYD